MDTEALLRSVKLFATTPPEVLAEVGAALHRKVLPAGTLISRKGEPGECMYLIADGRVRIHDGEIELTSFGSGEVVGEFALLDTEPRSADMSAATEVVLYQLDQADFYRIVLPHPQAVQGVMRHVLARLRSQNEAIIDSLRRRKEELEAEVAERTKDLSLKINDVLHQHAQLQEANQHKNEIIRIVSHDIRSPLSGIGSLAKLLQDKEVASDTPQVIEFAKLIAASANNVTNFVNDILDLAKLESGTTNLQKQPLPLADFLKATAAQFEPLTRTKGVGLQVDGNGSLTVPADRSMLGQAVNNLVSNSIKFTPQGGKVTLAVDTQELDGQAYAAIRISDTGIGIPAEAIPGLFDKFNKIQRSGTRGEKGTGLGMSIAKQIVDLHRGHILVDSVVNQGTTFTILLPLN